MAYQIVVLSQQSCSGAHWQTIQATVGGGTIVSVAFQNNGNAQNFWVSQMFPQSATQAYWQVINSSLTSTQWWPIVVIDTGDDADAASAAKATISNVESQPLSKKE